MKTYIHVNQAIIKKNKKTGSRDPVLTVKTYKDNRYGHEVVIYDKQGGEVARIVYRPDKPLSCGAQCWIVTENKIDVLITDQEKHSKPACCKKN